MHTRVYRLSYVSSRWLENHVDLCALNFSYPAYLPELHHSIKSAGILQPLLIREGDAQTPPLLICGHRRATALNKDAPHFRLPVLWLSTLETTLSEAFAMALADNTATRSLNTIEKARALNVCVQRLQLSREEILKNWLPLLGLQPSEKLLNQHLEILELPEPYWEFIHGKGMPLKTVNKLLRLHRQDAAALEVLLPLLNRFPMGVNLLDEVFNHLLMIAGAQGQLASEVLEEILVSPEVALLLLNAQEEGTSGNEERSEVLRQLIRKRAFPTLTRMEEEFFQARTSLGLPGAVSLRQPSNFEGNRYDVQFKFGSREELKNIAASLLESAEKSSVDDLLKLL